MSDFKITGPGEYKLRSGKKAVVLGKNPCRGAVYCWIGYLEGAEGSESWEEEGIYHLCSKDASRLDIIGPWNEA